MKKQQRYDLVTKVAEQLWAEGNHLTFRMIDEAVVAAGGANAAAQSVVYKDKDVDGRVLFGGLTELVGHITDTVTGRVEETVNTARGRDGQANRFLAVAEACYRWPSVERVVALNDVEPAGQYRKSLARLVGGVEVMVVAASLGRAVRLAESQGHSKEAAYQVVRDMAVSLFPTDKEDG